jgi:hypothetical protein
MCMSTDIIIAEKRTYVVAAALVTDIVREIAEQNRITSKLVILASLHDLEEEGRKLLSE